MPGATIPPGAGGPALTGMLSKAGAIVGATKELTAVKERVAEFSVVVKELKTVVDDPVFKTAQKTIKSTATALEALHSLKDAGKSIGMIEINIDPARLKQLGAALGSFIKSIGAFEGAQLTNLSKVAKHLTKLKTVIGDSAAYKDITNMFNLLWKTVSQSNLKLLTAELTSLVSVLERAQALKTVGTDIAAGLKAAKVASGGGGAGSGGLPGSGKGGVTGGDKPKEDAITLELTVKHLQATLNSLNLSYDKLGVSAKDAFEKVKASGLSLAEFGGEATGLRSFMDNNLTTLRSGSKQMDDLLKKFMALRREFLVLGTTDTQLGKIFNEEATVTQKAKIVELRGEVNNLIGSLRNQITVTGEAIAEYEKFDMVLQSAQQSYSKFVLASDGMAQARARSRPKSLSISGWWRPVWGFFYGMWERARSMPEHWRFSTT